LPGAAAEPLGAILFIDPITRRCRLRTRRAARGISIATPKKGIETVPLLDRRILV